MTALYRQNGELNCMYSANNHPIPTVFINTAARSSGVVFITASGFLWQKSGTLSYTYNTYAYS